MNQLFYNIGALEMYNKTCARKTKNEAKRIARAIRVLQWITEYASVFDCAVLLAML